MAARSAKLPPNAPPLITLSTNGTEYDEAQLQLERFIKRLQAGRRASAAELLSTRVSPPERRAFVEKRWLRYDPKNRRDFMQILFWKDIQFHNGRIYKNGVKLQVVRRAPPVMTTRKSPVTGILEVPMRREGGTWRVELHPPKA
jgi:hypothetical protein